MFQRATRIDSSLLAGSWRGDAARHHGLILRLVRFKETAAQRDLQQPAVRSMKWVGDFSRLESMTWSWWARMTNRTIAPACEEIWIRRFRPNIFEIGGPACLNPAHPLSAAIKPMSSRRRADGFRETQCVAIWVIDVL